VEPNSTIHGRQRRLCSRFNTTHWSVVLSARSDVSPEARQALDKLCSAYWYPLYAFVRRQGYSPHDAEDLVQEFFSILLRKKYLSSANPERGRFRSFLLASLRHFLANQWDHHRAKKRGGDVRFIPYEDLYLQHQSQTDKLTPEKLYAKAWALSVLKRTRALLKQEYISRHKEDRFEVLEKFLPGEANPLTYAEVAKRFTLSEVSVRSEVHRLRHRYGALLRNEIAQLVEGPEEVNEELHFLIEAAGY
jgi:RNA polymerase sigma factor (sigma-70 family)